MDRKKTSQIIKSKLAVKIFSIFLSIVLWFTVLNMTNPTKTRQIVVPLTFSNFSSLSDKNLGIKNQDYSKEVTLTVEGRNNDLNALSEKDFTAVVNINDISAEGSHTMNIIINSPENSYYYLRSINPEKLRLEIEKTEERLFSVEVMPEGDPVNGYTIINSVALPGDIAISSLKSVIASIGRVVVPIDVNQLDRNISLRKFCRIYNKNGEELLEFKDKFSVEAKINVAKLVSVVPVVIGKPGLDVFESTRQTTPEKLYITGSTEILSTISEIKTMPIDITGITGDSVFSVLLNIPEGVSLYNSPSYVDVSISVGMLETAELSAAKEAIGLIGKNDSKYEYELITPSIIIKLKGLRRNIEALTVEKLAPTVNVELLKAGTHRLLVELQEVEGITVTGSYFVEVKVVEKPPEETLPVSNITPTPGQTPGT